MKMPYRRMTLLTFSRNWVGPGSSAPKSLNMFPKTGTMKTIMPVAMSRAMHRTMMG